MKALRHAFRVKAFKINDPKLRIGKGAPAGLTFSSRRINSHNGSSFVVSDDPSAYGPFWERLVTGQWEPQTLALLDHLVTSSSLFVDIGAWIGPTTLYAAAKGANVDAYECDPIALAILRRNILMNPTLRRHVRVHDFALWDADGVIKMWSQQLGNSESSIFPLHERGGSLTNCAESFLAPARSAAAIFKKKRYATMDSTVIKIDVEGAEFRIIPSLHDIIAASQAIWYVSVHELNINPINLPAHPIRVLEVVRLLSTFRHLHWYDPGLIELDKTAVLEAIATGRWPKQSSFVFASRRLLPLSATTAK